MRGAPRSIIGGTACTACPSSVPAIVLWASTQKPVYALTSSICVYSSMAASWQERLRAAGRWATTTIPPFVIRHWLPICFLVATTIALAWPVPGKAVASVRVNSQRGCICAGAARNPPLPPPCADRPARSSLLLCPSSGGRRRSDHDHQHVSIPVGRPGGQGSSAAWRQRWWPSWPHVPRRPTSPLAPPSCPLQCHRVHHLRPGAENRGCEEGNQAAAGHRESACRRRPLAARCTPLAPHKLHAPALPPPSPLCRSTVSPPSS